MNSLSSCSQQFVLLDNTMLVFLHFGLRQQRDQAVSSDFMVPRMSAMMRKRMFWEQYSICICVGMMMHNNMSVSAAQYND